MEIEAATLSRDIATGVVRVNVLAISTPDALKEVGVSVCPAFSARKTSLMATGTIGGGSGGVDMGSFTFASGSGVLVAHAATEPRMDKRKIAVMIQTMVFLRVVIIALPLL